MNFIRVQVGLQPVDDEQPHLAPGQHQQLHLAPGHEEQPHLAPGHEEQPHLAPGQHQQPHLAPGHEEQPHLAPGHEEQPHVDLGYDEQGDLDLGYDEQGQQYNVLGQPQDATILYNHTIQAGQQAAIAAQQALTILQDEQAIQYLCIYIDTRLNRVTTHVHALRRLRKPPLRAKRNHH